jgi:hypothetical protein
MRISDGAKEMNVVVNQFFGDYEVVDVWTTVDGKWYVTDNPYSIPQWAVDEYAIAGELGGAHHLFVRVLKEDGEVDLGATIAYKNNALMDTRNIQTKDGFANIPVFNIVYPDQGQNGGWQTGPVAPGNTQYGVTGGGLPYGLHVSLFSVYKTKSGNNGNGNNGNNGNSHDMEVWIPMSNTTVHLHTNGHDFKMEVTK